MILKSFCTTKEMVSKLKKPECEKTFASYTLDKGLITRIYREVKKLNSSKINDPRKKWANELSRPFSKNEVQMTKKHMQKCSPSLAIKEMQIKTKAQMLLYAVTICMTLGKLVLSSMITVK
jgi:hypothetical protein